MNLNRMKKSVLFLLLAIPALTNEQNVMTETRQELTSPDGAHRFTYEDNVKLNTRTKVRTTFSVATYCIK